MNPFTQCFFMRCTGPNPIGYCPNLLKKLHPVAALLGTRCPVGAVPGISIRGSLIWLELGLRTNCHSIFPKSRRD